MSRSQAEIFESKLLTIIKNQNNIYEFIKEYINEKSYGTFRIFSKRLKELNKDLLNKNKISEDDFKKINSVIKNKTKTRNPEVLFNINTFYKKYIEFFEINKDDNKNLLNILFLMMPFLLVKTFKDIHEIKIREIEIYELDKCIIVKHINKISNEIHTVKISKFYNEWLYLFNFMKKKSNNEYLFINATSNYTIFNQKLEPYLSSYMKKDTTNTKYITLVKNALKYSKKSIFEVL